MRFVPIFLILLVGLSACTKKAVLNKEGAAARLSEVQWKVAKVDESVWKVGRTLRDVVSKKLTLIIDLPKIDEDDEEFLRKTYTVDSWLVRVIQITPSSARIELGTLHVPFRGTTHGRAGGLPVKSVAFALTYAAASMSERFRRFHCPAFSHDRRLNDYQIEGEQKPIEIVVMPGGSHSEKLHQNELVPTQLNIGHTMVGEYRIEVALLSTTEKKFYSAFRELPFYLKVVSEKTVSVEGCAGVHEEFEPSKDQGSGTIPNRQ